MAVKDKVKGICETSKCNYDVYTSEKIDELIDELEDEVDELNDDVTDLKGTVLFEGNTTLTNSSSSKITLSDDVSDYNKLEIFYNRIDKTTNTVVHQDSVKLDANLNLGSVALDGMYAMGSDNDGDDPYRLLAYSQKVSITGTQIKFVNQMVTLLKPNSQVTGTPGADMSIFITKVVGYK